LGDGTRSAAAVPNFKLTAVDPSEGSLVTLAYASPGYRRGVNGRPEGCVFMNEDIIKHLTEWSGDPLTNLHTKRNLAKAIEGLRRHPTRVTNLREAKAVAYVGDYIGTAIATFVRDTGERDTAGVDNPPPGQYARQANPSARKKTRRAAESIANANVCRLPPIRASSVEDSDAEDSESAARQALENELRIGMARRFRNDAASSSRSARALASAVSADGDHDYDDDVDDGGDDVAPGGLGQIFSLGRGAGRGRGCGRGRDASRGRGAGEGVTVDAAGECKGAGVGRGRGRGQGRGPSRVAKPRARNRPEAYEPGYRSGPHAMLVALARALADGKDYLTKNELIRDATPLADEPMQPTGSAATMKARYSGWSSMGSTLIKKGLVNKSSNPAIYGLTAAGLKVAQRVSQRDAAATARTVHVYDPVARPLSPSPMTGNEAAHRPLDLRTVPAETVALANSRARNVYGRSSAAEHCDGVWCDPPGRKGRNTSRQNPANRASRPDAAIVRTPTRRHAKVRAPRQRTNREIELAQDVASMMVDEGFDGAAVRERVQSLFSFDSDIPTNAEELCKLLRDSLPPPHAESLPGSTGFAKVLAVAGLASDLRRDEENKRRDAKRVRDGAGQGATGLAVPHKATQNEARLHKRPRTASEWTTMAAGEIIGVVSAGYSVQSSLAALQDVAARYDVEDPGVLRSRLQQALDEGGRDRCGNRVGRARSTSSTAGAGEHGDSNHACSSCGQIVRANALVLHESRCGHVARAETVVPNRSLQMPRVVLEEEDRARRMFGVAAPAARPSTPDVPVIAAREPPSGMAPPVPALAVIAPLGNELLAKELSCAPMSARIVLLMDNREIFGVGESRAIYVREMEEAMINAGLQIEDRVLPVGDAMFIAVLPDKTEIVLDWIVERKTLADFVSSVLDGRLKHQVFAMNACGLSNKMLLLEGRVAEFHALAEEKNRTGEEMEAILNDLFVCDGFFVNRTKNMRETIDMFVSMRRRLVKRFAWMNSAELVNGRLRYQVWRDRALANSKRLTLKQLFALQLCSLTGVGQTGAERVISRGIDTPAKLDDVYRNMCDGVPRKMEDLLSTADPQTAQRGLNAPLSSALYKLFTFNRYATTLFE
jgi:ERCC4-type nuclease